MKEIEEILDKRAEITSTWEYVILSVLILLVLVLLYILKGKIFYLISMMRIKRIEKQIGKYSVILRKYSNPNPKIIDILDELLQNMFLIYKTKLPSPISFDRLFPQDERSIMGELSEYELIMRERLSRYYELCRNIGRYYETEYGKSITLGELIRKIKT